MKSRLNEIEKELREEQLKSKALVAEHKKEIQNKEDRVKELLQNIKDNKSINTTVDRKSIPNNLQDKLIEFNCSECDLTFNLRSSLKSHVQIKHDKQETEASSEKREDTFFQKLRS